MDNTIVTYDAQKFRQNTKKTFKGHLSAGFGCQVGFSPNGRCVVELVGWCTNSHKSLLQLLAVCVALPCFGEWW